LSFGNRRLNVGIVGCGQITRTRHLPAYRKLSGIARVVALADLNINAARSLSRLYNVKAVYRNVQDMLLKESLDVVDICTPPKTHKEIALEAMSRGVHVLTEKPMAMSVEECEEMASCARDNDVKLSVIHQMLYYPSMRKAIKMVERGDIGQVEGVHIFFSEPKQTEWLKPDSWTHRLPGGLVGETGPHIAYLSLPFVGRPKHVDARGLKSEKFPWTPFVEYQILIQGDKGYSLTTLSYTSTRRLHVIQIVGSEGSIHVDINAMLLCKGQKLDLDVMEIGKDRLHLAASIISGLMVNSLKVLLGKMKLGHEVFIEEYMISVLENRASPVTPEEGTQAVRLMEMIVRSLGIHS
jgi:predicted dehydrogenase